MTGDARLDFKEWESGARANLTVDTVLALRKADRAHVLYCSKRLQMSESIPCSMANKVNVDATLWRSTASPQFNCGSTTSRCVTAQSRALR